MLTPVATHDPIFLTVILYATKLHGVKLQVLICSFSIVKFGYTGGVGGVVVTQSSCGAMFDQETVAQFVNVSKVNQFLTFHVK
jgi:hypothetical protein